MKIISLMPAAAATVILSSAALGMGADFSADDERFILSSTQDEMTEVRLGEIAKAKAKTNAARSFAEEMIKDHSTANAQLRAIAAGRGISVPADFDREHQALIDKFQALESAQFDTAYCNQMVDDHRKVVSSFEIQSSRGDVDLQNFAKDTLPIIRRHLQMAEKISSNPGM